MPKKGQSLTGSLNDTRPDSDSSVTLCPAVPSCDTLHYKETRQQDNKTTEELKHSVCAQHYMF